MSRPVFVPVPMKQKNFRKKLQNLKDANETERNIFTRKIPTNCWLRDLTNSSQQHISLPSLTRERNYTKRTNKCNKLKTIITNCSLTIVIIIVIIIMRSSSAMQVEEEERRTWNNTIGI